MEQKENKILLHACCGICAGYPIQQLKDMGYSPIVYFANSNIDTKEEFERRLVALNTVCNYHNVKLVVEEYNHKDFLEIAEGLEQEPERGRRCVECMKMRLGQAAMKTKDLGLEKFTTTLVVSPHKNYAMITKVAQDLADNLEYVAIDFKKHDGFLKTNKLSKELGLYRQNYCGCEFAKGHLQKSNS